MVHAACFARINHSLWTTNAARVATGVDMSRVDPPGIVSVEANLEEEAFGNAKASTPVTGGREELIVFL